MIASFFYFATSDSRLLSVEKVIKKVRPRKRDGQHSAIPPWFYGAMPHNTLQRTNIRVSCNVERTSRLTQKLQPHFSEMIFRPDSSAGSHQSTGSLQKAFLTYSFSSSNVTVIFAYGSKIHRFPCLVKEFCTNRGKVRQFINPATGRPARDHKEYHRYAPCRWRGEPSPA